MRYRSGAVKDAGYTLVEILVAITLFVTVSVITGTLIVQANQATRKATASAFTQSQLLDVVSRMSREIAVADPITYAGPTSLETLTVRDGKSVRTQFRYDAASGKVFTRSETEIDPATGQARTLPAMTDALTVTVDPYKEIASNVAVGTPDRTGMALTYFNTDGKKMLDPPLDATADLKTVSRVQIALTAGPVEGRSAPLTLQTSMATRLSMPASGFAVAGASATCPYVTSTHTATDVTLTWDPISGATGYDITRLDNDTSVVTQFNVPESPFNDAGLPGGGSFTYTVTPVGFPDCSASETVVNLAPGKPVLTGNVTGYYDANLTWSAVNGATGYILQRDGVTIQTFGDVILTPVVDSGLKPSVTYTYTVIATNADGNTYSDPLVLPVLFKGASDTFTGTNGSPLDITQVGNLTWLYPNSALFTRTSGLATTTTPIGSNPMAVVDPGTPNVDATIPTSTGGEALYLRVQDGTNWLRARTNTTSVTVPVYSTQWQYAQVTPTLVNTSYTQAYNYWVASGWTNQRLGSCWGYWADTAPSLFYNWDWRISDYTSYIGVLGSSPGDGLCGWRYSFIWFYADQYAYGPYTGYTTVYSSYWTYPVTGYYWAFSPWGGSDYRTGATQQVITGTTTTTTRKVIVEKSVSGTVTPLATYTLPTGQSFGPLRVVAKGTQITTYMNGSLGTVTEPTFQTATQVGVGLGGPTLTTPSGIDRFDLAPAP